MSTIEITDDGTKPKKKSNYNFIICPECKENARITINNYKFSFLRCNNGHSNIKDLLINDFQKTQSVKKLKILCHICNKIYKDNSYNDEMYLCLKCEQNLSESCKSIHDKTHKIIHYQEKFSFCNKHFEPFNSFCLSCNKDLCSYCEFEHSEHKIVSFKTELSNISKEKEEVDKFYNKKENIKNDIKDIINKFQNLIISI